MRPTPPSHLGNPPSSATSPSSSSAAPSPPLAAASHDMSEGELHSEDQAHLIRKPNSLGRILEDGEDESYFDRPSSLGQIISCVLLIVLSILLGVSSTYYYLAPHLALPNRGNTCSPTTPSTHQQPLVSSTDPTSAPSAAATPVDGLLDWSSAAANVDVTAMGHFDLSRTGRVKT